MNRPARYPNQGRHGKMTMAEFMAARPAQRRFFVDQLLAHWEQNHHDQCQADLDADMRAYRRGTVDQSPIQEYVGHQSSTNRTSNP